MMITGRWLLVFGLVFGLVLSGCVHVYRGAVVQMNLGFFASNLPGEHYELFANVHGGAVSLARFKVLDAVDHTSEVFDGQPRQHCGGDPLVTADVQRVQRWEVDYTEADQCDPDERVGTIDKVILDTATLTGGIRFDTVVELVDATALFISVESDADATPAPSEIVSRADLGARYDPFVDRQQACLKTYCEATPGPKRPMPDPCDLLGKRPGARRGTLLGSWVKAPATACAEQLLGDVAVVPSEDETIL